MKVVAISFSEQSEEFLNSLRSLEFLDEIYIASSSQNNNLNGQYVHKVDAKEFIQQNWRKIDLFIFVGSISVSVRLISPLLISKEKDPGVIVIDKKFSKIIPLIGIHQTICHEIALKLANLFDGDLVVTNNSIFEECLNLDAFGRNWGWNRSGSMNNWSNLVIKQSNKQQIFVKQYSGSSLWKESDSGKKIKFLSSTDKVEKEENTFFISTKNLHRVAWHPAILWVGIGCERNTSAKFIEDCINKLLLKYDLSSSSIAGLATVDIKKDEKALIDIAKLKSWPIKFFNSNLFIQSSINFAEVFLSQPIPTHRVLGCQAIL